MSFVFFVFAQTAGKWIAYYTEGQKKSEITYLHGDKKGPAKIYFENGNTAEEGTWLIDKWVGKYRTYYRNGKLSYSWNYNEKGTRSGYQQYFRFSHLRPEFLIRCSNRLTDT